MSGARHRRREHDDDDDEDQKYSRGGGSGSSSNSGSDHKSKLGGPRGSYWDYYVPKPEEPCPPPPIVNGYALEGLETMPSTGINYDENVYECFVCDSRTNTEIMLNVHLSGKPHIRKLEIAGYNSFMAPKPLGPIPGIKALKDEKWRTGEKRTYSEVDPTNKGRFSCEPCNLEFDARVVFETHMKGKPHAKMLKWKEEIRQNNGKASCLICQFIATSAVHLETHLQGKNHKKRVEAAKKGLPGGTPVIRR